MKYEVKASGRTAYELMTGHKVRRKVFGFGEFVHFQLARDKSSRNKFDGEWQDGYFAGVVARSSEYLVICNDKVFKCPTVRRRAEGSNYNKKVMEDMRADFFQYIKQGASTLRPDVLRREKESLEAPAPEHRRYMPRRVYLGKKDFDKYGHTAGCPACAWLQTGIGVRGLHSDACRDRIEECIRGDAGGGERLDRWAARVDHWMASEVEDGARNHIDDGLSAGQGGCRDLKMRTMRVEKERI